MVRASYVVIGLTGLVIYACSSDKADPNLAGSTATGGASSATTAVMGGGSGGAAGAGLTAGQANTAGMGGGTAGTGGKVRAGVNGGAGDIRGTAGKAGKAGASSAVDAGNDAGIKVEPPPKDVSKWGNAGSFTSVTESNVGPGNAYTLYRPSDLGKNGMKHPIVTWGNGTYTTPAAYDALLTNWATHGLVVVASNSTNTGSGQEMIDGFDWLISENNRSGSTYYGKLDTKAIGATGHSQGGIGTILAAVDPRVTTAMPIAGGDGKVDQIHGPVFLIGFGGDTVVPPPWNMAPQYEAADVPSVYGVLQGGATHMEAMGDGGRMRGYATAWLLYQLMKDDSASGVFYGQDCTLCKDPDWVVERKLVPGVVPPTPPTKDECLSKAYFPSSANAECKDCLCRSCPLETVNCNEVCWNLAECMIKQCAADTAKDLGFYDCTGITAGGVCGTYADGYRWTTALSVHGAGCMAPGKCLEICIP